MFHCDRAVENSLSHFVFAPRSKGEVQTTFLCHEGFLGTLGAFWSYENMGIDGLESHEVIREVLLGAPYTGNFPSLPLTQEEDIVRDMS
jgi:type II pantothenate kinase